MHSMGKILWVGISTCSLCGGERFWRVHGAIGEDDSLLPRLRSFGVARL